MYIIELIVKKILEYKRKTKQSSTKEENIDDKNEEKNCSHIFLPLDSTGVYLACTKCGLVIKNDKLKDNNL